jgi:NADPH:quinone reductase-like Zn-dependent oxidoreductase
LKAIVFHEHGGPNVLRYEDVEKPRADPGSVLLKIRASSLTTWT